MSRSGPAPQPTHLKVIRGNPGKRALPKNEPKPTPGIPDPPPGFSKAFEDEWRRTCADLADMGLLAKADRGAIVGYCESMAEFIEMYKLVEEEGRVIVSLKTMSRYMNPSVGIKNAAMDRVLKFAQQLGLTPSARTRIKTNEKPEQKDDLENFASKRA